ncbi:MAG: hypothetical protein OXI26_06290 [bacterium]|nr:hypothetical protein [bacterium]
MNQKQGSAESGDVGRARAEPQDTSSGKDRPATRWLVWVALAAAIVVAAVCATDDPVAPEPVGAPGGGDPGDCYTTEADQPQHPRDTNRYLVALTSDDADAGALDEYAHCQHLPATNPESADPDCYSTGDDNEWNLPGANLYALALLKGGASAGALDKYAKCEFMPAVLGSAGDGTE